MGKKLSVVFDWVGVFIFFLKEFSLKNFVYMCNDQYENSVHL